MIIWIMMTLDLIGLTVVTLAHFKIIFATILLLYAGGYFILKLIIFKDILSGIDAVFGVYTILIGVFHFSSLFYYLMLGWFTYKFILMIK